MSNVIKHSNASKTLVTIRKTADFLFLQIKDDGIGFDSQKITMTNAGNGFASINERIKILKGTLETLSELNKGAIFNFKIPINHG
jgi:NarL family two-component system sensor histidine kinase YdfH